MAESLLSAGAEVSTVSGGTVSSGGSIAHSKMPISASVDVIASRSVARTWNTCSPTARPL